jgi:superfamily II DNA/RNA helicase
MDNLEEAVRSSIDFLKTRHYPEKAHISLLSPPNKLDYKDLWKIPGRFKSKSDEIGEEKEEDEEDSEIAEEIEETSRLKTPGWIFGSDFNLETSDDRNIEGSKKEAETSFRFYVRVKPDYDNKENWDESAYTRVYFKANYREAPRTADFQLSIQSSKGNELKQKTISLPEHGRFVALVVLPKVAMQSLDKDCLKNLLNRVISIGIPGQISTTNDKFLTVDYLVIEGDQLTGEVFDESSNKIGEYHHAFSLIMGKYGDLFKIYLANLGGIFYGDKAKGSKIYDNPFRAFTYNPKDKYSRWALGYLFEVEGEVKFYGWRSKIKWDWYGLSGAYPINTIIIEDEKEPGKYLLRDYVITEERLPSVKKSKEKIEEFFKKLSKELNISCKNVDIAELGALFSLALQEYNKSVEYLYTYQEEATREILKSLAETRSNQGASNIKAVSISARTAGGKTLGFLIPTLFNILLENVCERKIGVKAILMYPTKALANDQVEELSHILFRLYQQFEKNNLDFPITFGYLHGNTPSLDNLSYAEGGSSGDFILPIKCPIHGTPITIKINENSEITPSCPSDSKCEFSEFLRKSMKLVREEIYFEPPDILITDPDMLNRILSGEPKSRKVEKRRRFYYEWQIFGYPYVRCKQCRHTYPKATKTKIKKCVVCGSDTSKSLELVSEISKPKVIIIDEAHEIYGSFGIQVHHMLSLLEHILGYKPFYVLASATLGDIKQFTSSLLGIKKDEVKEIKSDIEKDEETLRHKRLFAFLMPKAYSKDSTISRFLGKYYEHSNSDIQSSKQPKQKGIIFTNYLAENNLLLNVLKDTFGNKVKIDGHSTDYNEEREESELRFKKGDIDIFVATKTLELGIDYGVVDFVGIYGMPAKITNFIQRIGRAGRTKDAAIIVVFNPDNPIDYFYYENYKLLYDGALREEAMKHETSLISPINEEAVKRAIKRWFVAKIIQKSSDNRDTVGILIGNLDSSNRKISWENLLKQFEAMEKGELIRNLPSSLSMLINPSSGIEGMAGGDLIIKEEIRSSLQLIKENVERGELESLSDFLSKYDQRRNLHSLRSADKEIPIEFQIFSRKEVRVKELRYVIKHTLNGQFFSYKGKVYAVKPFAGRMNNIKEWLEKV